MFRQHGLPGIAIVAVVTSPEDVDEAERAAELTDDADEQPLEPEESLPLEAEPADVLEQALEVPQDDDYREG